MISMFDATDHLKQSYTLQPIIVRQYTCGTTVIFGTPKDMS